MRILVDADACPVKDVIIEVAQEFSIQVIMVNSISHYSDFNDGVQHIIVDNIPQAADMVIINKVQKGDIVITQDYGLAALILEKCGNALHHTGKIYTGDKIEHLLFKRHLAAKIRRSGGKTQGPKAFTKQDKENFRMALQKLVLKLKQE